MHNKFTLVTNFLSAARCRFVKMKHLFFLMLLCRCLVGNHIVLAQFNLQLAGNPVNTNGWTFGAQSSVNNDAFMLVNTVYSAAGYIYYNTPQTLPNHFTACFSFRITDSSNPTADGIAFWYVANSPPASFGIGHNLGLPNNADGLVLILDTYDNDNNANVPLVTFRRMNGTGNYVEGSATGLLAPDVANQAFITDTEWHTCVLRYDNGNITVAFDGGPPMFSVTNVPLPAGFTGYFGFSASTGAKWAKHFIKDVSITDQPQVPATVTDTIICTIDNGFDPVTLNAPPGYISYIWDDNSTSTSRTISAPGTYWVEYNINFCDRQRDSFFVHEVDLSFNLGENRIKLFCDNVDAFQQLEANNIPGASYLWQDGSTDRRYLVTQPGTYWVEVRKDGCVASDTIRIEGVDHPNLGPDIILCKGDPVDFVLHAPDAPPGAILQWSTGSTAATVHVNDTGLYWINLIQPPCVLSDSIRIATEVCECFTRMPNAFTPNGDGTNDRFMPVVENGCIVRGYAFSIYNRFGERVFHSVDATRGWDGYYKGNTADAGTYFYEMYLEGGTRSRSYYYKGNVELIR